VTNSIFFGNVKCWSPAVHDEIYDSTGLAMVTYSDIRGGYAGEGNIDADPMFVDSDSGDYHLQPGSPCIDTGDNEGVPPGLTTDFEGNPRIVDGDSDSVAVVDMGADEYCPGASVDISVVLQGGSRTDEGWVVPVTIKFFSPGADVLSDSPVDEFNLTTTKSGGTSTCQCISLHAVCC